MGKKNIKVNDFNGDDELRVRVDKLTEFTQYVIKIKDVSLDVNYESIINRYIEFKNEIEVLSNQIVIDNYIKGFSNKWEIVYNKLELLAREEKVKRKVNEDAIRQSEEKQRREVELNQAEEEMLSKIENGRSKRQKSLNKVKRFYGSIFKAIHKIMSTFDFWALLVFTVSLFVGVFNFNMLWARYVLSSGVAVFSIYINYKIAILSEYLIEEWIHYTATIIIKAVSFIAVLLGLFISSFEVCVIPFSVAIVVTSFIHMLMSLDCEYGDDVIDCIIGCIGCSVPFMLLSIATALSVGLVMSIIVSVIGVVTSVVYFILVFVFEGEIEIVGWVGLAMLILQIICGVIGAVAI